MIAKRLSDIVPERVGDFRRWYLSRAEPGHQLSVRYVEVTGIVPPHSHLTEETLFYVEGKGSAGVGEREVAVKPGTMLAIPLPQFTARLERGACRFGT